MLRRGAAETLCASDTHRSVVSSREQAPRTGRRRLIALGAVVLLAAARLLSLTSYATQPAALAAVDSVAAGSIAVRASSPPAEPPPLQLLSNATPVDYSFGALDSPDQCEKRRSRREFIIMNHK